MVEDEDITTVGIGRQNRSAGDLSTFIVAFRLFGPAGLDKEM